MKPFKILLLVIAVWCGENSAIAQTWTLTTAPYNNWVSVASSADGNTLVALTDPGFIYVSTNSGAAWRAATNAPSACWVCASISADGSKMAAGIDGGTIYTSNNHGLTWKPTTAPTNYWESIACSADGRTLAAAAFSDGLNNQAPGQIHTSKNSGLTWRTDSVRKFWLSIASSSDGSKLVAVASDGSISTSQNLGLTWRTIKNTPTENWFSVASSTNGNNLVVVANAGPIYTSTNAGTTWKAAMNAPNASWASVASSSDGSKLAAVQWGGQIYASTDWGATWFQNSVPNTFLAGGIWGIAESKDGNKILAAGDGPYGGPIYILQPMPKLNIGHAGLPINGMVVSWPSSASGFVLQQSSNLTTPNWTAVMTAPRATNGQIQTIISPPAGFQLFRLAFPTGSPPLWWPHPPPPIIIL